MNRISTTHLETPIGTMILTAKSDELTYLSLPNKFKDNKSDRCTVVSVADSVFENAINFLKRYFKGEHVSWAGNFIPDGASFHRRVWTEAAKIPFGETLTYGDLAERAGNPRAARAVGSAMASNSLPILVPCHRVIGSNGRLGGFGGGLDMKRWLLKHEGIIIDG